MTIHGIGGHRVLRRLRQMHGHLVPEEIEIDPAIAFPAEAAAQHPHIKAAGGGKILHGNSQVKTGTAHGTTLMKKQAPILRPA